jgi:hypothetical protein
MAIYYPSAIQKKENDPLVFSTNTKILKDHIVDIVIDSKLDISNTKILVLSLVNNCGNSIHYINEFIKDLIKYLPNTKFCFFSNNNQDSTEQILTNLSNNYPNYVHSQLYPNEKIVRSNRIEKLAKYRDLNFIEGISVFGSDFDYLIVFDSDLSDYILVKPILDSLKITNIKWSCISGNHCYKNSQYYYDDLALRLIDDPINIKEKHQNFDQFYGHSEGWIDTLYIVNNWHKVQSAFGGVSIYKMPEIMEIFKQHKSLYEVSSLPKFTAEHIALNLKLSNNILINPNIRYTNSVNIEGKMYQNPITFIPRDAGFFSVFNFYIGCLSLGLRAYPLFSKKELLKLNNNINEHFCYWTTNENCWFDYFEPVKFFDNDQSHNNNTYKLFTKSRGEIAPTEFRIPKDTKNLIQDKERFNQWRHEVHQVYKQYIKYRPEILSKIDEFWNSHINSSCIIGVHYRHPSHFVESGKIYLEDYFTKIDDILSSNPDAQIFLATDSNFGIYAFQEKYGNKVFYIKNVERLSMPEFLHWCFSLADGKADDVGFINGKGFELHHKRVNLTDNYKLTVDLLSEVLCLSNCNYMVHTTSNVALAISYINPNLELVSL